MRGDEQGYYGWKNWETWNVALWIQNDGGLYDLGKESSSYSDLVAVLREMGSLETPDGVAWNDSGLDTDRLDEMLKEL